MTSSKASLFDKEVELFAKHLRHQDLSPASIDGYLHDLKRFREWLEHIGHRGWVDLNQIGTPELGAYRKFLIHRESSRSGNQIGRELVLVIL